MSNWDRLAVMELFEAIQRTKLDVQSTEHQKTELDALVHKYGHKAKTIDVSSADVKTLRAALCRICSLGDGCLLGVNQCCNSKIVG